MTDISGLTGVLPTSLRWNAEEGLLTFSTFNEALWERELEEIELGSATSKFAMDVLTREHGTGKAQVGVFDMRLVPVDEPKPQAPDADYKDAIGCYFWNPRIGEAKLETNGAILRTAYRALIARYSSFKEATQGLVPLVCFIDRREVSYSKLKKTFWAPRIDIVGWCQRDRVPPFALRLPTVKPPIPLDSQISGLESLQGLVRAKLGNPKKPTLRDELDDELPDNL